MTRLSRIEQVERNRELVLAAARRVFLARGYAGATLEAIAEDAGFSKGVVYSQFASKADLFLALLARRKAERAEENAEIARALAGPDGLRALLRAGERHSADAEGWARLLIEFRVYAARDAELNRRYADAHSDTIDHLARAIGQVLANAGIEPDFPPRVMAQFVLAIGNGLVLEQAADPDALPPAVIEDFAGRAFGIPYAAESSTASAASAQA